MADEGNTEVQARIIELEHIPGIPIGKRLRVFDSQGQRAVYYGPTPIQLYDISDKAAEAACIAMLSRIGLASDVAIASPQLSALRRNTPGEGCAWSVFGHYNLPTTLWCLGSLSLTPKAS